MKVLYIGYMSEESWKPVVGYEGLYEVSDLGRVQSLDRITTGKRNRRIRGRMLSLSVAKDGGYHVVNLWKDNRLRVRRVSVLVLEAFVGPRPEGMVARHWPDRDPTNNRLENLRWGTQSENMLDKRAHGTDHEVNKTHCTMGHRLEMPNLCDRPWRERGHRRCLACARGRAAISYGKLPKEMLQEISDRKYAEIMQSAS